MYLFVLHAGSSECGLYKLIAPCTRSANMGVGVPSCQIPAPKTIAIAWAGNYSGFL